MSSSASSRPTAARRPRRCSTGLEVVPAPRTSTTRAARSRRWTSTPSWRAGPQLVLVDELAHTNAPGSRHPKRYQDVEELLAAGIDVYTTLNIQHLESLNDVVAQITRVRVRETVPDSHPRPGRRDRADRPHARRPDPAAAARARSMSASRPQRALRALFLARQPDGAARAGAAPHRQRVDEQMLELHAAHAIAGPVGGGRAHPGLRRRRPARRRRWCATPGALADRLRAPGRRSMSRRRAPAARRRRSATGSPRRCAWPSGWAREAVTVPGGAPVADELLDYARANNITHIVIGKSRRSRWFELLTARWSHDLVRAPAISASMSCRRRRAPPRGAKRWLRERRRGSTAAPYLWRAHVGASATGARLGIAAQRSPRHPQHLAGVPEAGAGRRRAAATACGRRCSAQR